jgi:hypothetical protein
MLLTQEWLYRPRDANLRFAQVDALSFFFGWLVDAVILWANLNLFGIW